MLSIKQIGKLKAKRDNPNRYRVYDSSGISPTLTNMNGGGRQPVVQSGKRLRRLTPRECFRLQGFPDEYFERAAKVNSDSELYKQAGNSVTVNVVYEIARRLKNC